MQAIADELGVTKQALLYHFGSKEGLREAALQEIAEVWRTLLPRLLAALTREGSPMDEALGEVMTFFRREPAYARFLLQELLQSDRPRGPIDDIAPWLGAAGDFLRRAQAAGQVAAEVDPEAWVINIGTLILSTLSLLDDKRPGPDPERLVRELARIAATSLRGGRPPPP